MIKKGLSQRHLEVGKIKIGGRGVEREAKKTKQKYRLPVKFDHFVITTTEKDNNDNFIKNVAIHKIIGEKPMEIGIQLPFDDIDMNFYTSYAMYKGRKPICSGDGIKATRVNKDGTTSEIDCLNCDCAFMEKRTGYSQCKPSGILSCYLSKSYDIGGIYRFRTTSWNTISGILAALQDFKNNIPGGILQGLPFKLKLLSKSTAEHGNVQVVTIVGDGVAMMELRQLGFDEQSSRKKLGISMLEIENHAKESGFDPGENDTPGEIQDEFHPEVPADTEPAGTTATDAKKKMEKVIQDAEIIEPEPDEPDSLL